MEIIKEENSFMRNIKQIGLIDEKEIEKYQKGNLDSNAVKMKMPKNMNQMMIKSMPFTILAFVIMVKNIDVIKILHFK